MESREEELQTVIQAYCLEEDLATLRLAKSDLKDAKPKEPTKPKMPSFPDEELRKLSYKKIEYPKEPEFDDIKKTLPDVQPWNSLWKLIFIQAPIVIIVSIITNHAELISLEIIVAPVLFFYFLFKEDKILKEQAKVELQKFSRHQTILPSETKKSKKLTSKTN